MSRLARAANIFAAAAAGALLLGAGLHYAGARVNTTRSIAVGLYWTSPAPVAKGEYVMFCPPPAAVFVEALARGYIAAGFCPGHLGMMMKKVLAAKGDTVDVSGEGVRVNGTLLPNSRPRVADPSGRPMPRLNVHGYALGADQLLLMTDRPMSFDGRYYGLIARNQIKTVIRPVWTW